MAARLRDGAGDLMPGVGDILMPLFRRRYSRAAGRDDRPLPELCRDLLGSRAEVSGMELARRILDRYRDMDDEGRRGLFRYFATDLDLDPEVLSRAAAVYAGDRSKAAYRALSAAAEPPRQELCRRLNQVPGATERLVEMRDDLLRFVRDEPALERVDIDFGHLFTSWFNRGFLVLQRIDWDTPASVLEKIIAYEAVHTIESWDDLRRRLQPPDRRCFAFFHPAMPDEPLIFVEVALTRGIPDSIQRLLEEGRNPLATDKADTAVFYSISNCQPGLAGISFGNSLIKQVVTDLSGALPNLSTFVTLSPIPGLARWAEGEGMTLPRDPDALRRLAARYLIAEKRDGRPWDPVARFHLGNGAQVHAVHAGADTSAAGLRQSGGAMVNYRYDPGQIAANHEAYATEGRIVASRSVQGLARADVRQREKQA